MISAQPAVVSSQGASARTAVSAMTTAHEIRDRYTILGDGVSEPAARETASVTGVI